MVLRITIDVFSGRPNPTVELTDAESADLLERLTPQRRLEPGESDLPPEPVLGYRGVLVEQTREPYPDLPSRFVSPRGTGGCGRARASA